MIRPGHPLFLVCNDRSSQQLHKDFLWAEPRSQGGQHTKAYFSRILSEVWKYKWEKFVCSRNSLQKSSHTAPDKTLGFPHLYQPCTLCIEGIGHEWGWTDDLITGSSSDGHWLPISDGLNHYVWFFILLTITTIKKWNIQMMWQNKLPFLVIKYIFYRCICFYSLISFLKYQHSQIAL